MLFVSKLKENTLSDPSFKHYYDQECHICRHTIQIISEFHKDPDTKTRILSELNIPEKKYQELASGDQCDPGIVVRISEFMKLDTLDEIKKCPRLIDPSCD